MSARVALLVGLAACGRLGFETTPATSDAPTNPGDGSGSAVAVQWAAQLGNNNRFIPVSGAAGAPVAAWSFTGSTTVAGHTLTGSATDVSSIVARFDASGALQTATVVDASTTCDIRGVSLRGDTALLAGFAFGDGNPSLGPCNVSAPRQAPLILAVDSAGAVSRLALGAPSGSNAQAWNVRALADGTLLTSGIYSMGLSFGATTLPAAGADPNGFLAHVSDSQPDALWAIGLTASVQVTAGPIALEGDELCMLGGYVGSGVTELGTALPYVGSADAMLARLDDAGTPTFVRGFGSPAQDSYFNDGSVAAIDGGCIGSIAAPGDVTIDGTALPVSDGNGVVAWFDSTGALAGAFRVPEVAELAVVGTRVVAAYTVTQPVTIGGATYTPRGSDVIVVEIAASGPTKLVGAIGGAGDQSLIRLAAIGPNVVAMTLASSGDFELGSTTFTNAPNDRVLAVLGI